MVQMNVAQLLKSPIGAIRNHRIDESIDIAYGSSQVQGSVRLTRTNRSILVKGKLHTEIELTCCRCLSSFNYLLNLDIEDEYFPTTDIITDTSIPVPDEPGCFTIDQHNILDLTEAIRQYALINIPMKPLCHDDCAGLCPTCGHNLNQAPYNCPAKPLESRWAKLSKLILVDSETSASK